VKIQILIALLVGFALRLSAGELATAVSTITAGFVTGITVTSGGSGYLIEPVVTITGGGGSGARAKAVLAGDKVGLIIVLVAGSGYTSAPLVTLENPPIATDLSINMVPAVTVSGRPGSTNRIEWSDSASGPWNLWTNLVLGSRGAVLVDFSGATSNRFYRSVSTPLEPAPNPRERFVWIAPGKFLMGSPETQLGHQGGEIYHSVTISKGFWISDHETTQSEYQSVIGSNPSHFLGPDLPVETVTWNDAMAYCQELTIQERAAGHITPLQEYRLPTEAEWEYACRAGTTDGIYGQLDAIAWWAPNSGHIANPVRTKQPNAWGLFDMIGNVSEWCSDWYANYPTDAVTDPTGPSTGSLRIARGGSWSGIEMHCRAAVRFAFDPLTSGDSIGFRAVLTSGE
jgi:formylglycine-generating enzyme required for sulfatase activity